MSAQEAIEIAVGTVQPTISRSIRMLLAATGGDQEDLAPVLRTSESTVSRKLSGHTKWTPDDIDRAARYFSVMLGMDIGPGALFLGASEMLAEVQNRKKNSTPDLRILRNDAARTTGDRAMLMLASDTPSDPI